jgi:glyoxylase-like metal-dependent hydrolase (beta-lactamase superfamily II)
MNDQADGKRGSRVLAAIGVLTLVTCGFLLWPETPESASRASLALKKQPMKLLDGVYMLGSLTPSVAYVIDTSEGLVLIDTGIETNCTALLQQFKHLQLDPSRIKKVLLTHAHGDHVLGAMYLAKLTGAEIYGGTGDVDVLQIGGPREAMFSTYDMPDVELHPTEIDISLSGGETIELGDTRIEVIATPGHTPGSLCFLLERANHRILFTGDTISTISGDLGTYGTYLPPRFRSNADDYLTSLKTLRDMDAPDVLLPGHPRIGSEQQQYAEVTEKQWLKILDAGIQEMQLLVERFTVDGRDFLDGNPIEILDGLLYLGDFSDSAVYVIKDRGRLVLFDPPAGAGFLEFLEKRLGRLGEKLGDVDAVALTSCDPATSGGLLRLVQKFNPVVIISRQGRSVLRSRLPNGTKFLEAETLDGNSGWPFRAVVLAGRGLAPVALTLHRNDKQVLISGRILSKLGNQRRVQVLLRDLNTGDGDTKAYLKSLELLEPIRPDIWLPISPVNGQNANLYDDKWQKVIQRNRDALRDDNRR